MPAFFCDDRRRALLVSTAALLGLAGCGAAPPGRNEPEAENSEPVPLPDVALARLDAPATSLATFVRGQVAVIDLWASWCTACRETSARVERLAQAYRKRLLVVAVNVGEEREVVERHLGGAGALPMFLDDGFRFSEAIGARELPLVLVVDARGQIVHRGKTVDRSTLALIRELVDHG
jgi:cytochrome c biogenesis protein CcmG/thiol:disulfide interchange protein DsbE